MLRSHSQATSHGEASIHPLEPIAKPDSQRPHPLARPVTLALGASLLVHALGLTWLLTRPEPRDIRPPESALRIILQPPQRSPQVIPVPPAPVPGNRLAIEQVAEPETATPPGQTVEPALTAGSVAPARSDLPVESRPQLNLQRPEGWDALATETPEALSSLSFRKSTREAVARRKQERARSRVLTRAQVARLGLPESTYRRRTNIGEELKTAKGCFVKRVEQGLNGYSERWWRTSCRDSRVPAWKREVLTFGPDHRVIPGSSPSAVEP